MAESVTGKRPPSVRVVHAHATRQNVGDDAIVMAIHHLLGGSLGPPVRFTDLTRDLLTRPGEPIDRFIPLYQYHRLRWWPALLKNLLASRYVVIGGGEIVTGAIEFLGLGLLGLAAGRPVLCLGVGANFEGTTRLKRAYARLVYRRAHHVTRDPAAATALRELGVPPTQITASWDVVLALPIPDDKRERGPLVGLSLRSPQEYHPLGETELRRIAAVLDEVVARGGRVLMIPFLHPDSPYETARLAVDPMATDTAVLDRCRSYMTRPDQAELYQGEMSPGALIRVMQGLSGLLAMRLHASILSLKAGLRPIAIGYAPKIGRTLHHIDPEIPVYLISDIEPTQVAVQLLTPHPGPGPAALRALGVRIQQDVNAAVAAAGEAPGPIGTAIRLPLVLFALLAHALVQFYFDLPPFRHWFRRPPGSN